MNEYEQPDDWPVENVPLPPGVIACGPDGRVTELPPEDVAAVKEFSAELELLSKANAIIERLDLLAENKSKIEDEEKFLRSRLATLFPMGTSKVGARSVSIRENRRFDVTAAERILTPTEKAMCTDMVISSKLCREHLAPARYAECQVVTGDPVVRVS